MRQIVSEEGGKIMGGVRQMGKPERAGRVESGGSRTFLLWPTHTRSTPLRVTTARGASVSRHFCVGIRFRDKMPNLAD